MAKFNITCTQSNSFTIDSADADLLEWCSNNDIPPAEIDESIIGEYISEQLENDSLNFGEYDSSDVEVKKLEEKK